MSDRVERDKSSYNKGVVYHTQKFHSLFHYNCQYSSVGSAELFCFRGASVLDEVSLSLLVLDLCL